MGQDHADWRRDIRVIRGVVGTCHLLIEPDRQGAVLLDAGFVGDAGRIRRALNSAGLGFSALRAILLTHGHLDHVGHLAWVKAQSGAPIYAHPAEQAHIDGTFPYTGLSRWCGRLERLGRAVLGVGAPARIDVPLADGDELPWWGGLRVVHLPGHTLGHCGFYSERHEVLFCGDLYDSYFFRAEASPGIFTSAPELLPGSLEKVRRLNPRYLLPQHYDVFDCALHRRRFDAMMARCEKPTVVI